MIRRLFRHPGFLTLSVAVYALCTGAAVTLFGLIETIVLQSPPFERPSQLMYVCAEQENVLIGLPFEDYTSLRDSANVFADVAARGADKGRIEAGGSTDRVNGEMVSANFFATLGVQPALGRSFQPSLDAEQPVVVIGHDYWHRRFRESPSVIGRTIRISPDLLGATTDRGREYTVIGVMPEGFSGLAPSWKPAEFWVPYLARARDYECIWPVGRVGSFVVVGRVRQGVGRAQGTAELLTIGQRLKTTRHYDRRLGWTLVVGDRQRARLPFDGSFAISPTGLAGALFALAGALVVIGGLSLAGVLMARQFKRSHEIAVRVALGASPRRIRTGIVSEAVGLACIGAPLGLLASRTCMKLLIATVPASPGWTTDSLRVSAHLGGRAIAWSALVGLATALMVSMGPALACTQRGYVRGYLGEGGVAPRTLVARLRYWIAVPQVCLSLALLIVGSHGIVAIVRQQTEPRGYDATNVVFVRFSLPPDPECAAGSGDFKKHAARWAALSGRVAEAARSIPYAIAAVATTGPMERSYEFIIDRQAWAAGEKSRFVYGMTVSADYFAVMRIPVIVGRVFDQRDHSSSSVVAVVSRSLAQRLWGEEGAVGRYVANLDPGSRTVPSWLEVIGVVADVAMPGEIGASPMVYKLGGREAKSSVVLVRGGEGSGAMLRKLLMVLRDAAPGLDVTSSGAVEDSVRAALYPVRMATWLLIGVGAGGCLLSCVALFGATRQTVAIRHRELGVRIALGATRWNVTALMVREGSRVLLLGSGTGFVVALGMSSLVRRWVVALPALDGRLCVAVPLIVSGVVLAACYCAAFRAGRMDPATVLREE